jgi:hypothetical protein
MARYSLSEDDIPFAAEFLAAPFGYKSPGLQRVLNLLRGPAPGGKYVLVCKEPYRRWGLARLPERRGEPVTEIAGVEYADLETAERDVFLRRWRDFGGPALGAAASPPRRS